MLCSDKYEKKFNIASILFTDELLSDRKYLRETAKKPMGFRILTDVCINFTKATDFIKKQLSYRFYKYSMDNF